MYFDKEKSLTIPLKKLDQNNDESILHLVQNVTLFKLQEKGQ